MPNTIDSATLHAQTCAPSKQFSLHHHHCLPLSHLKPPPTTLHPPSRTPQAPQPITTLPASWYCASIPYSEKATTKRSNYTPGSTFFDLPHKYYPKKPMPPPIDSYTRHIASMKKRHALNPTLPKPWRESTFFFPSHSPTFPSTIHGP